MYNFSKFSAHAFYRGVSAILMLCFGLFGAFAVSAAHTSVECPAQSGSVASGGKVSINITNCATMMGLAGTGAVDGPVFPASGSAALRIDGKKWFVDYSHRGNSATSDVFEFTDGTVAGNTVRVSITISKAKTKATTRKS
jgi:large repetitive protein